MMSFASNEMHSSPWRPCVSSPLASSPIRASSPESPTHENRRPHAIQSSPIRPPTFRYASRPSKPNPIMRRREDTQEQRRRNFLQSVRQKTDDKAWQRRDIEGQSLKTSWLANVGRLSHDAPTLSDVDIEDAVAHSQEEAQSQDADGMLEAIREEQELDLLVSSYEEEQRKISHQQPPSFEADDYDDIFAELISRESSVPTQHPSSNQPSSSNQMDMSD